MARIGDGGDLLKCNFCGKSQKQVKKLIAGPNVYICDECIELCNEIIEEELAEGAEVSAAELRTFLEGKVAHWQLPERWSFIDEVPKTSVGKYDKKVLRSRLEAGELGRVETAAR